MASLIFSTAQFVADRLALTLNPALRKDGGRLQVDPGRRGFTMRDMEGNDEESGALA